MEQNTANSFIETEVFDLNLKKKISHTKTVPYSYANIFPPYVDETTYEEILDYGELFDNNINLEYFKTWYTEDLQDVFGYTVSPYMPIPYSQCGIFGVFYDKPENLLIKKIHEDGHEVFLASNYFEKGSNPKFIEFAIKNFRELTVDYFQHLEKYNDIKCAITQNDINEFAPSFLADLDNQEKIVMRIDTYFMPYDNNNVNIFFKYDETYYFNLKQKYYQNFVDLGILSQEQCDYIFEVSPGAERTILKFTWEESKLSRIELESTSVFQFSKVWTRT